MSFKQQENKTMDKLFNPITLVLADGFTTTVLTTYNQVEQSLSIEGATFYTLTGNQLFPWINTYGNLCGIVYNDNSEYTGA
jgi:hypothetical protein